MLIMTYIAAVSFAVSRRNTEYPLQLATHTELDAEWIHELHNHLLLLHKSHGASSLRQGRKNRGERHSRNNHVHLHCLGCQLTNGTLHKLLYLDTTHFHLGFHCLMVHLPHGIWGYDSLILHQCLQSLS